MHEQVAYLISRMEQEVFQVSGPLSDNESLVKTSSESVTSNCQKKFDMIRLIAL